MQNFGSTAATPGTHAWPPLSVSQAYLKAQRTRMKQFWGRMAVLHATRHPRNPRPPGKRKYAAMGISNPMSYVRPGSAYFPKATRNIISALKERGLPCVSFDTRGIVYAIFFTYRGNAEIGKVYVGITYKSVMDRFAEHVREAIEYLNGARILLEGDALDLHKTMALHGVSSCIMVPLQKVEGVRAERSASFYASAKRFERYWIQALQSLAPNGFNKYLPGGQDQRFSKFVGSYEGVLMDLWNPLRYLYSPGAGHVGDYRFHYRDYICRLLALHERRDLTGSGSITAVVRKMRRRNLTRMLIIGLLHHIHDIPPDEQFDLCNQLRAEIERRSQVGTRARKTVVKMFIPHYESALLDLLPLQQILANSGNQSLLPVPLRHVHMRLAFSYDVPIGRRWFNYKRQFDGSEFSFQQLQEFADQPCNCSDPEFAPFRPPGCNHVCTPDATFLQHLCPELPNLAAIWRKGSKFRPQTQAPLSEDDKRVVFDSLGDAMGRLTHRLVKHFSVQGNTLNPWSMTVLDQMRAKLACIPTGIVLGLATSPHYGHRERDAMTAILSRYLCTPIDKSSNGMCLTCKHFSVHLELDDLNRNGAGEGATYQIVPQAISEVVSQVQPFLQSLKIKLGTSVLPGYMGIPKLHKPQLAFRFIATSAISVLRPLALKVTVLLRALEGDLDWLWRQHLSFPPAAKMGRSKHWILRNSPQLMPTIQAFNMQNTLQQADASPPWWLSWDSERLFTELDQADLKERLCWLLDRVFELRPDRNLIRVCKGRGATWSSGAMPPNRSGRTEGLSTMFLICNQPSLRFVS